jgi:hypothetical protein
MPGEALVNLRGAVVAHVTRGETVACGAAQDDVVNVADAIDLNLDLREPVARADDAPP